MATCMVARYYETLNIVEDIMYVTLRIQDTSSIHNYSFMTKNTTLEKKRKMIKTALLLSSGIDVENLDHHIFTNKCQFTLLLWFSL